MIRSRRARRLAFIEVLIVAIAAGFVLLAVASEVSNAAAVSIVAVWAVGSAALFWAARDPRVAVFEDRLLIRNPLWWRWLSWHKVREIRECWRPTFLGPLAVLLGSRPVWMIAVRVHRLPIPAEGTREVAETDLAALQRVATENGVVWSIGSDFVARARSNTFPRESEYADDERALEEGKT